MLQDVIYLDNAATEPLSPAAFYSLKECYEHPELYQGNPNSSHLLGSSASSQILKNKKYILEEAFATHTDLIMTSGSTESINLFYANMYHYFNDLFTITNLESDNIHKCLFLYSDADHKAVKNTSTKLFGLSPVEFVKSTFTLKEQYQDNFFEILQDKIKAVNPTVIVMNVTVVNNETGSIFPFDVLEKLRTWCKEQNIQLIVHGDFTQGFLKQVSFDKSLFDAFSISIHKVGGLKGIGLLTFNDSVKQILDFNAKAGHSFITGGGQQNNYRSGTQNPVAYKMIADLIKTHNELIVSDHTTNSVGTPASYVWNAEKRWCVFQTIKDICESQGIEAKSNVDLETSSPYILSLCLKGLEAESFMAEVSQDFAISAGSACNSETLEPSYVLQSLGVPLTEQNCTTRWSFSDQTDLLRLLERLRTVLPQHIKRLKGVSIPFELMEQLDDGTCDINHEEVED